MSALKLRLTVVICFLAASPGLLGQKPPLDHDAYDIWQIIKSRTISHSGKWLAYVQGPDDGDDVVFAVRPATGDRYRIDRGASPAFSPSGSYLISLVKPALDSLRAVEERDVPESDRPKDSLLVLNLETGVRLHYANVASFKIPEDSGDRLALLLEEIESTAADDTTEVESEASSTEEDAEEPEDDEKKDGTDLIIRNLDTSQEATFPHVVSYIFANDGGRLAYAASSKDGVADALVVVDLSDLTVDTVATGPATFSQLAWSEAGNRLAFLSDAANQEADHPAQELYLWNSDVEDTRLLADMSTSGIPSGWEISENGTLDFSENEKRLFFGTAPEPDTLMDPEDIPEHERVEVDIWHWKDPLLQPMQLENLEEEKNRSYRAVVVLSDESPVVQLADRARPEIDIPSEGNAARGTIATNHPYRMEISWDYPSYYDLYGVDITTGEHRLLAERIQSRPQVSPDGAHIVWWDRETRNWLSIPSTGGAHTNLTGGIDVQFDDDLHDWPYGPGPYGAAGWTEDGTRYLVYDKYDIWALDPTNEQPPANVTAGFGADEEIRLRYVHLEEEPGIPVDRSLWLSGYHYETRDSGYFTLSLGDGEPPVRRVWSAHRYGQPERARDGDRLVFTRSSVSDFPDLWTCTGTCDELSRVSEANPQQSDYNWATVEPVSWYSLDGQELEGLLYKPEDFQPDERYPTLVYFYEKNSENLHQHPAQVPHRSIINPIFYASRGYLVFVPDIPYKIGYPGESALNAVMTGVTHLIDAGMVDPERIGVQGHSWGGYQIAYMITRTNLFRAAAAGAPVANMTSAYGGIRWGSGMSRMFQYERTQSRIGGSLWEKPLRYLENSPVFWADKIRTPVLILHNDEDGAVPWYQGIEFFVALRRLSKPAWMINYNGEPHWPLKYQNRVDWQTRLQQYFDHYLKDAPAPVWLEEGVPAVNKGITLGLETKGDNPW